MKIKIQEQKQRLTPGPKEPQKAVYIPRRSWPQPLPKQKHRKIQRQIQIHRKTLNPWQLKALLLGFVFKIRKWSNQIYPKTSRQSKDLFLISGPRPIVNWFNLKNMCWVIRDKIPCTAVQGWILNALQKESSLQIQRCASSNCVSRFLSQREWIDSDISFILWMLHGAFAALV